MERFIELEDRVIVFSVEMCLSINLLVPCQKSELDKFEELFCRKLLRNICIQLFCAALCVCLSVTM